MKLLYQKLKEVTQSHATQLTHAPYAKLADTYLDFCHVTITLQDNDPCCQSLHSFLDLAQVEYQEFGTVDIHCQ